MDKVKIEFEHCYGVSSLTHEFDFSDKTAVLIYAPNGAMKTSFAKTFKDIGSGAETTDRVYPERESFRKVSLADNSEISPEAVFVVEPYDSSYESGRVSSLLVNRDLKTEYDKILKDIDKKVSELIDPMKKTSGIKRELDELLSQTFSRRSDNLLKALERVRTEVIEEEIDSSLEQVPYNLIFNDKVEKLLSSPEVKTALDEYTNNYERLVSQSRFFRRGVFNHYQANEIAKQLKNHGFFKADHKVFLNDGSVETEVTSEDELQELIANELASIFEDTELKASFDKIDKKITNVELRKFRDFLLENQGIIPRLQNTEVLREDVLKYHLMLHKEKFSELLSTYDSSKKRLDEIVKEASEQATKWQEVINIFNRRFSVPFKVVMQNKHDVILKRATPNVAFEFEDGSSEPRSIGRDQLIEVLSNGERRALYILNIIFEVEARLTDDLTTLFIIDDIADSFDYKNKYAIVEYLADVLSVPNFRQIILTHNYDFYRTVWKRLHLDGMNFHVSKTNSEIVLTKETMYRDPFEKWKRAANNDQKRDCLFAMIPFVRNLAGYCGYNTEEAELTTALHVKLNDQPLTIGKMLQIFKTILNGQEFQTELDDSDLVLDALIEVALNLAESEDPALDLEKKVVLAIAIRLLAEQYMIAKIDDDEWAGGITRNQTATLARKFKELGEQTVEFKSAEEIITRVNLMTPENIHLNSFMYEPILDMSSDHLKTLLLDVVSLESQ